MNKSFERNINFKRNLTDGHLIRKCVQKVFDLAAFMFTEILLRLVSWVENTWFAPVEKRLKWLTLNVVHT